ncbi:hypothetical protein Trydic_g6690 [Trypoxylus dichotomus]
MFPPILIEGFEDNGNGNTIFYSFLEGTTKSASLVRSIKDIIKAVHKAGLHILATVCDQGTTNVSAIRTLVADTKANYLKSGKSFNENVFAIDGKEVIPIYDPPHLLKGIRNNFLTKNIGYVNEAGTKCIVTWNDVIKAYKIDAPSARLRLLRKITDFHVLPSKIKKIKVAYCTQVFSKQYTATITRMSHDRSQSIDGSLTMTDSAIHTAYLLSFFDDLFDSVNGTARRNFSKPLRNVVTNESQHIHFWNKAIKLLQNIRFLDAIGRWANSPPLLKNWILTLQSFKLLHKKIRDMGYTNFSPRSFNQDPLGNYFGQIRMCGGRNISPSPTAFSHFFKGLLALIGFCRAKKADMF